MFKIWEALRSSLIDDRLIEFMGELSEAHVAGTAGLEGGAQWKDVGIWSETEWTMLMTKALGSMSTCDEFNNSNCQLMFPDVPVGAYGVCVISMQL
jgi:hypothetical protein